MRAPRCAALWLLLLLVATSCGTDTLRAVAPATMIVNQVHRRLYLDPPPPPLVPELFDYLLALAERHSEIPLAWGSYLYTQYYAGARQRLADGAPRPSIDEMRADIGREIEYYYIRVPPTPDAADTPP